MLVLFITKILKREKKLNISITNQKFKKLENLDKNKIK